MLKVNLTAGETKGLTGFADARKAILTIEGDVRIASDGTTPDADCGHSVVEGGTVILQKRSEITNFKAYAVTDATIQATMDQ